MHVSKVATWTSRLFVPVALVVIAALVAIVALDPVRRVTDTAGASASASEVSATMVDESTAHTHDATTDMTVTDHAHDETVVASESAVHDHSTTSAGESSSAASSTHSHETTPPDAGGAGPTLTGPIVSVDDPRLSPAQQNAARTLLVASRATVASLPNESALRAAGYTPVGDNSSGLQHWTNDAYTHDGRELDPSHIEVLMTNRSTGRTVGAMYMLEPGKTMANVPDIAGELTQWHVHPPICFSTTEIWRYVAVATNRNCPAGSAVRDVPPMMHVWSDDPPCGPFVGTDGHGSTTCTAHSH